jgi:hypothetical protein
MCRRKQEIQMIKLKVHKGTKAGPAMFHTASLYVDTRGIGLAGLAGLDGPRDGRPSDALLADTPYQPGASL